MKKPLGYKGRSVWKGYAFHSHLNLRKLNRTYCLKKKDIGKEAYIYNGKDFKVLTIVQPFVGYKLGQFCITKKLGRLIHVKKNTNVKNKKANKASKKKEVKKK